MRPLSDRVVHADITTVNVLAIQSIAGIGSILFVFKSDKRKATATSISIVHDDTLLQASILFTLFAKGTLIGSLAHSKNAQNP